jgi:Flp pilus assembly protein TadB
MHTVTSFPASAVRPEQLSGIMADYLALERARAFRRLLVTRFGIMALMAAVIGAGLHRLLPFASWCSVGALLVPPVWAWMVELRRDLRLARRLEELPAAATHVVPPNSDSRKS